MGPARAHLGELAQAQHPATGVFQAAVGVIDVGLFGLQLWMSDHGARHRAGQRGTGQSRSCTMRF